MAEFPALPIWTDAYISDTAHLTNEEHGAYLRLLMFAWRAPDCSLPDDDKRLCLMLAISPKKWATLKPVVMSFWRLEDGKWIQKRLKEERAKVINYRDQKAEAGRKSAELRAKRKATSRDFFAPRGNDLGVSKSNSTTAGAEAEEIVNSLKNNDAGSTDVETNLSTEPSTNPSTKSQESISISNKEKIEKEKRVNGTRLDADFKVPETWFSWAKSEWPSLDESRLKTEALKFENYWKAKTGQDATKRDWFRTWQNWCLRAFPAAASAQSTSTAPPKRIPIDRQKSPKLFAKCEQLSNRQISAEYFSYAFPSDIVIKAQQELKKADA